MSRYIKFDAKKPVKESSKILLEYILIIIEIHDDMYVLPNKTCKRPHMGKEILFVCITLYEIPLLKEEQQQQ